MGGIVRAEPGWEDAVSRALDRAQRPIPLDERLLPRNERGEVFRSRYDRAALPPARPAATLLAIYPDASGRLVLPLTVRRTELRAQAFVKQLADFFLHDVNGRRNDMAGMLLTKLHDPFA